MFEDDLKKKLFGFLQKKNPKIKKIEVVFEKKMKKMEDDLKKILELSEMARTFIEKFLGQSLLGEKLIRYGERKEEKKTTNLVATNVCHAARLQRRTGSARTSLGPIRGLGVSS